MNGEKVNGTGNAGEVPHNDRGEDMIGNVFLSLSIFFRLFRYVPSSPNLSSPFTFNPSLPYFPPGIVKSTNPPPYHL